MRYDGCLSADRNGVSEHTYSYSMGFGDAWFLLMPNKLDRQGNVLWRGGSRYNHGMDKPRYPVPAIILEVESYVHDLTIVDVHTGLDVAWFYRT